MHLKLGMIFSLASLDPKCEVPPLPLLALGKDTWIPNELMSLCSKYARRCVTPLPNDQFLPTGNKKEFNEAGWLSIASDGVCYLGDWSKYETTKNGFFIKAGKKLNARFEQQARKRTIPAVVFFYQ